MPVRWIWYGIHDTAIVLLVWREYGDLLRTDLAALHGESSGIEVKCARVAFVIMKERVKVERVKHISRCKRIGKVHSAKVLCM